VPQVKDVNEFYLLAGHQTIHEWLRDHVAEPLHT